ncbi:TPA: hypothetical protein QC448_002689 [Bacillus cereus]|uniref:hypothetical protein n=1 Tax=Bacillus TaxID=1386 RepID=UPI000EA4062E|nr:MULTISPECIES: hypothetical protein [Bacillus cereus group]MED3315700.1 hypothetical protein [Bacillus wiedmannii]RKI27406.1 hypothetical protein D7V71_03115 [Bacillus thuringiensis]HDR8491656.1 hypothetical protein [Bacillus cereus]
MNAMEVQGLQIAVEIFEKKCMQLVRHRNPNIYLKSNAELFSDWFEDGLNDYTIQKLGANAHPDLIVNGVGIELKSLKTNSQIQFNSTIPCGGFRHGNISGECYYAVARYTTERNYGYLEDFTICDGDFFNHDREKAFSHHNEQVKGFGDFGDGVCRHRKMYSFPSPLRSVRGVSLISKFSNATDYNSNLVLEETVARENTQGEEFIFYVYRHNVLV